MHDDELIADHELISDAELISELEQMAVDLALDAAAFVASHRPGEHGVLAKSSATDLVTDVDRASEQRLVNAIRARRPQDSVVGEEHGHQDAPVADPVPAEQRVEWVIDPIDGTVNFVLGLPMYSISVAARLGGRTVAGCVVDVVRGECFHARLGGGAWVRSAEGARLRLHGPRSIALAEAVVGTGFSYDAGTRARQGAVVGALVARVGNIRRMGSAALDLCYVAAGRLDAYFEAGLGEWDRAAGLLIAAEAGARVQETQPRGRSSVLAAGPIFDDLSLLLRELGNDSVLSGELGD